MRARYQAFTLVEMLIVIVVIGLLVAALVPRLISIQSRARDVKRKSDLHIIFNANEIYKADKGAYALALATGDIHAWCGTYNCASSVLSTYNQPRIAGLAEYINGPIPIDPLNAGWAPFLGSTSYTYWYANVTTRPTYIDAYDLIANLENSRDPETCFYQNWKWGLGKTSTRCPSAPNNMYELSPYSQ